MLTWLARWFRGFASTVSQGVIDMVHWAVHALASVVLAVFNDVDSGWADLVRAADAIGRGLDTFGSWTWASLRALWRHTIPQLWRYIIDGLQLLRRSLGWVWDHAQLLVRESLAMVSRWLADLWRLVLRDVYDPLRSWADTIYKRLIEWGFTAWWWITHLDKLADAMIFHIAASLEKNAWQLADQLGQFVLALLLRNAKRVLQLLESIVSAVL